MEEGPKEWNYINSTTITDATLSAALNPIMHTILRVSPGTRYRVGARELLRPVPERRDGSISMQTTYISMPRFAGRLLHQCPDVSF